MHPHLVRIAAFLLLLGWPLSVLAIPPPGVSGVTATLEGNDVRVRWQAPAGEDISRYRIYFGHESIIGNAGAYDDFESTPGDTTEFLLTNLPPLPTLYVAVLAVNAAGEEGAAFGEEAVVDLPQPGQDASLPASSASPEPAGTPDAGSDLGPRLRLLSAQAVSGTGVALTFSEPVAVRQEESIGAFQITDASGAALPVLRITVFGPAVTLDTAPLRPGVPYTVKALLVRAAADASDGFTVPVDGDANTATFVFNPSSSPSSSPFAATVQQPAVPLPAPSHVTLKIERMAARAADIVLTFDAPADAAGNIASFEVFQSADGGKSFLAPQAVPGDARSVRFSGVPFGAFAVLVRARAADGRVSAAVPAAITVKTSGSASRTTPLESTGAGVGTVLVMSGAIAGWRKMRM